MNLRKILSVLMAGTMVSSLISMPAWAVDTETPQGTDPIAVEENNATYPTEEQLNLPDAFKDNEGTVKYAYKNGVLQLTGDVNLTNKAAWTVKTGVTVTLDLNGHTLKKDNSGGYVIVVQGELTILDSEGGGVISREGTKTIIDNNGILILGDAAGQQCNFKLENDTDFSTAEGFSCLKIEETAVSTTIYGGTYTCWRAVQNYGKTVIHDGTFNGRIDAWSWKGSEGEPCKNYIQIHGGTFCGDIVAGVSSKYNQNELEPGRVVITGGTFQGQVMVHDNLNAKIKNGENQAYSQSVLNDTYIKIQAGENGSYATFTGETLAENAAILSVPTSDAGTTGVDHNKNIQITAGVFTADKAVASSSKITDFVANDAEVMKLNQVAEGEGATTLIYQVNRVVTPTVDNRGFSWFVPAADETFPDGPHNRVMYFKFKEALGSNTTGLKVTFTAKVSGKTYDVTVTQDFSADSLPVGGIGQWWFSIDKSADNGPQVTWTLCTEDEGASAGSAANGPFNPVDTTGTTVLPDNVEISGVNLSSTAGIGENRTYADVSLDAGAAEAFGQFYKTFTVTVDAQDGTTATQQITNERGKLATGLLATPTRSGYTFNGWFDAATGGNAVTAETVFTADTTIYAQWTKNSSSSGGSGGSGGSGSSASKTETTTDTVTNADGSTTTVTTTTTTNRDGSTTTTVTDTDGNRTETTTKTDKNGTTTVTTEETKVDAEGNEIETKSELTTDANGVTTGTVSTEVTQADGTTVTTQTEYQEDGTTVVTVEASLSEEAVQAAVENDESVTVSVGASATKDRESAAVVRVTVPERVESVKVEIPVEDVTPGTVIIILHEDGTEEIVTTTVSTEAGVQFTVTEDVTVMIIDNAQDFTDTEDHWAKDAVDFVTARALFNGIGNGEFDTEGTMTRGMVNTVLARLAGADASGDDWKKKGAAWAMENNVSDGTNLDSEVTREQLVTMLYRYSGAPEVITEGAAGSFTDGDSVSDWADVAMEWAIQIGLLSGDDTGALRPGGDASRAEVATILMRFINLQR